jgi:hypothetical protein
MGRHNYFRLISIYDTRGADQLIGALHCQWCKEVAMAEFEK